MLGKVIKNLLATDKAVLGLVGTKIYPYIIAENTSLPAVIYTVDEISPVYSKDGWENDEATFSVHCFSTDYSNLQTLTAAVRSALELKTTGYSSITIQKIYLTGVDESYEYVSESDGFFTNRQSFKVTIKAY